MKQQQHLMVAVSVLVLAFVCCTTVTANRPVCGNVPTIWRSGNTSCEPNAICADVFNSDRDWQNGTRCAERRVINNCLCDGYMPCPIDGAHKTYRTQNHEQYTCNVACAYPWCDNLPRHPVTEAPPSAQSSYIYQQRQRRRRRRYNFMTMECRCLRHHAPSHSENDNRALTFLTARYDFGNHRSQTSYSCFTDETDMPMADPCDV